MISLIALILGILTPYSYITTALHTLAAGVILGRTSKSHRTTIVIILIYTAVILLQWGFDYGVLTAVMLILANFMTNKIPTIKHRYIPITLGILIINLFASATIDGAALRSQLDTIPTPPYQIDMTAYLKTYYLLEAGENYYQAFATTIPVRLDGAFPGEIWGWKQPLIFYLWSSFTNSGQGIVYLAAGLFAITSIAIYKATSKIVNPTIGLLSVYMVFPYFHYPLVEMTLVQVEWWALCILLIGMWAYLDKRYLLTGSLFAVSLAIRELYAIPMVGFWLLLIWQKEYRNAVILSLPIVLVFFPYFILFHVSNVIRYEGQTVLTSITRSDAASGWHLVRTTLAYDAWSYALGQFKLFHLLIGTTTLGLLIKIRNHKKTFASLVLLTSYLVFFILSFKLKMMNTWHDYWGIYYIPLLLIATPVALNAFKYLKPHPHAQ